MCERERKRGNETKKHQPEFKKTSARILLSNETKNYQPERKSRSGGGAATLEKVAAASLS